MFSQTTIGTQLVAPLLPKTSVQTCCPVLPALPKAFLLFVDPSMVRHIYGVVIFSACIGDKSAIAVFIHAVIYLTY